MSMDTIAPTRERLARAMSYDGPAVDQDVKRQAHRLHSLVEHIYRQHKLSKDCFDAYRRFESDYMSAQFCASRVCRYGANAGSTPIEQLTEAAMDAAEMQAERRMYAEARLERAMDAVGGRPLSALIMAIHDTDLATIGRELSNYRAKMQAQAAGLTLLHIALDRLCLHYDEG